jgi:hypothetical protein
MGNSIKRVAGNVWNGLKRGGSTILGGLNKGRDVFNKVYNVAKDLPIVGNIVDQLKKQPIYKGLTAEDMAKGFNTGLNVANGINEKKGIGDIGKGVLKDSMGYQL